MRNDNIEGGGGTRLGEVELTPFLKTLKTGEENSRY